MSHLDRPPGAWGPRARPDARTRRPARVAPPFASPAAPGPHRSPARPAAPVGRPDAAWPAADAPPRGPGR